MTETQWLQSTDPERMLAFLMGPVVELHALAGQMQRPTDRQLRLFCVACCCAVWHMLPEESQLAVQVAERHADGKATEQEVTYHHLAAHLDMEAGERERRYPGESLARLASWTTQIPEAAVRLTREQHAPSGPVQAHLLRDILGNPWRRYAWTDGHDCSPSGHELQFLDRRWLTWQGGVVQRLAEEAYQRRAPDGVLDPDRLAVLADALEDAGADCQELLDHCRGKGKEHRCRRCDGNGYLFRDLLYGDCMTDPCEYCDGTGVRPALHVRGCHVLDLLLEKS